MKTKIIVYLDDGSIEENAFADIHVGTGKARYATPADIRAYEQRFARDDTQICRWCDEDVRDCTLNECPEPEA